MAKNIILDEDVIKRNKIDVLIYDDHWKKIFKDQATKAMKKNYKDLEKLCKEEQNAKRQIIICKNKKKKVMQEILELSNEVNNNKNESALHKLELARDQVLINNDQIDDYQFQIETLPKQIEKLNLELLEKSVNLAYEQVEKESKMINTLKDEIEKIRQKLYKAHEEKIVLEENEKKIYAYLHKTLGYEQTNKIDQEFF
ncbi:hypothetical protein IZY60_07570 [Lutibacter sp. B2]|nr:hypothetical protein [Lutibacter sp. B2]